MNENLKVPQAKVGGTVPAPIPHDYKEEAEKLRSDYHNVVSQLVAEQLKLKAIGDVLEEVIQLFSVNQWDQDVYSVYGNPVDGRAVLGKLITALSETRR